LSVPVNTRDSHDLAREKLEIHAPQRGQTTIVSRVYAAEKNNPLSPRRRRPRRGRRGGLGRRASAHHTCRKFIGVCLVRFERRDKPPTPHHSNPRRDGQDLA